MATIQHEELDTDVDGKDVHQTLVKSDGVEIDIRPEYKEDKWNTRSASMSVNDINKNSSLSYFITDENANSVIGYKEGSSEILPKDMPTVAKNLGIPEDAIDAIQVTRGRDGINNVSIAYKDGTDPAKISEYNHEVALKLEEKGIVAKGTTQEMLDKKVVAQSPEITAAKEAEAARLNAAAEAQQAARAAEETARQEAEATARKEAIGTVKVIDMGEEHRTDYGLEKGQKYVDVTLKDPNSPVTSMKEDGQWAKGADGKNHMEVHTTVTLPAKDFEGSEGVGKIQEQLKRDGINSKLFKEEGFTTIEFPKGINYSDKQKITAELKSIGLDVTRFDGSKVIVSNEGKEVTEKLSKIGKSIPSNEIPTLEEYGLDGANSRIVDKSKANAPKNYGGAGYVNQAEVDAHAKKTPITVEQTNAVYHIKADAPVEKVAEKLGKNGIISAESASHIATEAEKAHPDQVKINESVKAEGERIKNGGTGTHAIEESEKFAKVLKAGAMALPLIGAGITGAQAADKIDAINNSDLSPEAKAAAHGFNAGMTLDALIDTTVAGSMAGQEAAKKGMVAKYGEGIKPFLVQTDGEALAEAAGTKRFASTQDIIDKLPKDPAVLKSLFMIFFATFGLRLTQF